MSVGLYGCVMGANCVIGKEHHEKFSKLEKIGIVSSILLGTDAIFTPALTGGRTFHQVVVESIGLSVPVNVESGIKGIEFLFAYLGQTYWTIRNLHLKHKYEVKE